MSDRKVTVSMPSSVAEAFAKCRTWGFQLFDSRTGEKLLEQTFDQPLEAGQTVEPGPFTIRADKP